jgi:hypothetical protein
MTDKLREIKAITMAMLGIHKESEPKRFDECRFGTDLNPLEIGALLTEHVPWLIAEVERLQTAVETAKEEGRQESTTMYLEKFQNGTFTFTTDPDLLTLLAGYMVSVLDAAKAPNYCEFRLRAPEEEWGSIVLRVFREPGKTPAELNQELKARVARLETEAKRNHDALRFMCAEYAMPSPMDYVHGANPSAEDQVETCKKKYAEAMSTADKPGALDVLNTNWPIGEV